MAITFYYAPQSSAFRVHCSLEELGVPYEKVKLDLLAGDQKKPEFLAINPNGKVPTVVIDGTPMFEALAIQIALGERYGVESGLWPALGSPEHLQALTWLVWGQVTLTTALLRYFMNTSDRTPKEMQHAGQAESALKELHESLRILNARLDDRDHVAGDRATLADVDLSAIIGWGIHTAKLDMTAYPKLAGWLGRMSQHRGMRAVMAAG